MTIHKQGYGSIFLAFCFPFGMTFAALGADGIMSTIFWIVSTGLWVLFLLVIWFFRMPKRKVAGEANDVFCPADGKVVVIEKVTEEEYFLDERIQVSIFMSPLNAHAQWTPFPGTVTYKAYHPGQYLVAWHPKSSQLNERSTLVIQNEAGTEVLVRQIAGAVARRIVTFKEQGDIVAANEEIGFIKFGSRVDVFLPTDALVNVQVGDKVVGNQTLLSRLT